MNKSLFQQENSKRSQGEKRLSLQLRQKDTSSLQELQEESKREKERAWRQKDQSNLQARPSLNQWSASYVRNISISLMQAS